MTPASSLRQTATRGVRGQSIASGSKVVFFRWFLHQWSFRRVVRPDRRKCVVFCAGCEIVASDEDRAHRAGALLGKSRTNDVVDATVVVLAIERSIDIVSHDVGDMRRLVAAARVRTRVHET